MVTADFVMTPDVIFKDGNAGGAGVGAAVGSLFGGIGSLVGAVAGGVKFQEAQTTLTMADTRSTHSGRSGQRHLQEGGLGIWRCAGRDWRWCLYQHRRGQDCRGGVL